ncbi:CG0192-related protein [Cellulomonas sp. Marseille-Q8402]
MAIIHQATLVPTKAEVVAAWLPDQPWFDGPADVVRPVGAYRFDDPAGEVGIESHLLDVDGRLVHVPLTYRGAELPGARQWLLGTTEHSVLGTRWVYAAEGDPVYRAELTRVIREAGTQVRMFVRTPEGDVEREPTALVRGSGVGGGVGDGAARVTVVRFPTAAPGVPGAGVLTGTWAGQDEPAVLAHLG